MYHVGLTGVVSYSADAMWVKSAILLSTARTKNKNALDHRVPNAEALYLSICDIDKFSTPSTRYGAKK